MTELCPISVKLHSPINSDSIPFQCSVCERVFRRRIDGARSTPISAARGLTSAKYGAPSVMRSRRGCAESLSTTTTVSTSRSTSSNRAPSTAIRSLSGIDTICGLIFLSLALQPELCRCKFTEYFFYTDHEIKKKSGS